MISDQQHLELLRAEAMLLQAVAARTLEQRYRLLWQVWRIVRDRHTPLIVGNRVYFLFWGAARSVAVVGDWTGWRAPETLHRIPGTNFFVLMKLLPETACVQYKLIVDGRWDLDPQNPRYSLEGFGVNSELVMPHFAVPEIVSVREITGDIPETVVRHRFQSTILGEEREIFFYLLQRSQEPVRILLFHDGEESLTIGGYHLILERLFQQRDVPSMLAVFLPPKRRNEEYEANPRFLQFCAEEVPEQIAAWCEREGIAVANRRMLTIGASLAGLVATLLTIYYPDRYGGFIAQSPAYWWMFSALWNAPELANLRRAVGVLQTGTIADARVQTQLFFFRFRQYTHRIAYQETHQGHTWGQWRRMLAPGFLRWLELERGRRDSNPRPLV